MVQRSEEVSKARSKYDDQYERNKYDGMDEIDSTTKSPTCWGAPHYDVVPQVRRKDIALVELNCIYHRTMQDINMKLTLSLSHRFYRLPP